MGVKKSVKFLKVFLNFFNTNGATEDKEFYLWLDSLIAFDISTFKKIRKHSFYNQIDAKSLLLQELDLDKMLDLKMKNIFPAIGQLEKDAKNEFKTINESQKQFSQI